jgi:hypothetical protein
MRENQQIQQLFIKFIIYVWQLLHDSALHCHPQGAFLVPSERCLIEEQSNGWYIIKCVVTWPVCWSVVVPRNHDTMHSMNRYVYVICEVSVTVNVHTAVCILPDAASSFFQNTSPCRVFQCTGSIYYRQHNK